MTLASVAPSLAAVLARLGITVVTVEHPPVHTVEEASPYWERLEGRHTKNLFLKDAKGELWLVTMAAERRADLKSLAREVGAKRFSFANETPLQEVLGVRQGAVSPLALINDKDRRVRLLLDAALLTSPRLTFHPLTNAATVSIGTDDFLAFLAALERKAETIDFDVPGASAGS